MSEHCPDCEKYRKLQRIDAYLHTLAMSNLSLRHDLANKPCVYAATLLQKQAQHFGALTVLRENYVRKNALQGNGGVGGRAPVIGE